MHDKMPWTWRSNCMSFSFHICLFRFVLFQTDDTNVFLGAFRTGLGPYLRPMMDRTKITIKRAPKKKDILFIDTTILRSRNHCHWTRNGLIKGYGLVVVVVCSCFFRYGTWLVREDDRKSFSDVARVFMRRRSELVWVERVIGRSTGQLGPRRFFWKFNMKQGLLLCLRGRVRKRT